MIVLSVRRVADRLEASIGQGSGQDLVVLDRPKFSTGIEALIWYKREKRKFK